MKRALTLIAILWILPQIYSQGHPPSCTKNHFAESGSEGQLPSWAIQTTFSLQCVLDKKTGSILEIPIEQSGFSYGMTEEKIKMKLGSWFFRENEMNHIAIPTWDLEGHAEQAAIVLIPQEHQEKCEDQPTILVQKIGPNQLKFKVTLRDGSSNRIAFEMVSHPDEQIFGLGEQFSHFNLKGLKVPVFVEEQGVGRGDKGATGIAKMLGIAGNEFSTYCPMPVFMTSDMRAVVLNTSSKTVFDFSNPDKIIIEAHGNTLEGTIFSADNPAKLMEQLTLITGRFRPLPEWAYGTWLGIQGGREKVEQIVEEALADDNPVSAVWIQDWVGKRQTAIGSRLWWNWQIDTTSYPDFSQFCTQLNDKGIKVLGYINPFLAPGTPQSKEAIKKELVIKNKEGQPYEVKAGGFKALLLDLTNPACTHWIKSIIKNNMIDAGLSGWMADFGEWLPLDAVLLDGRSGAEFHNEYPVEWQKINQEAVKEAGKENEIVIFNRSGFTNSARYGQAFWAGDQLCNWGEHDGLQSALTALLTSGLSGISVNHSDIGGYTSGNFISTKIFRDRELFYRWCEMATFTPIFRTHEGLSPDKNFQFYDDAASRKFFARMGRIHHSLTEYFTYLNEEAVNTGNPMVRPLWFHYPKDTNTYDLKTEFMLGEDILVVPVLSADTRTVSGYFPGGEWEHLFTGEIITRAGYFTIDAPMGTPAVFVKRQSDWGRKIKQMVLVK